MKENHTDFEERQVEKKEGRKEDTMHEIVFLEVYEPSRKSVTRQVSY